MQKKYGEAGFDDEIFYLLQDNDIEKLVNENAPWMKNLYKEFMKNTLLISEKIDFKIEPPKETDTLPKFLPEQKERKELLKKLLHFYQNYLIIEILNNY